MRSACTRSASRVARRGDFGLFAAFLVAFAAVGALTGSAGAAQEAGRLDFAHFANGTAWITELVFANTETRPSRPALTPFHAPVRPSRPVIHFYDTQGDPIAPDSLVDITDDWRSPATAL